VISALSPAKVISQNEYPDSIYASRANQNVPFRQQRVALIALPLTVVTSTSAQ